MDLELKEATGRDRQLYDAVISLGNRTNHLMHLASRRGQVDKEIVLLGERDNNNSW